MSGLRSAGFRPFQGRPSPQRTLGALPVAPASPPVPMTGNFSVDGIVPGELKTGVFMGMGGAAIASLAGLLPTSLKPLGMVAGVSLAGIGVYRIYDTLFGDPELVNVDIPPQSKASLNLVSGRILAPSDGSSAELSSMWGAVAKNERSYRIIFQIFNDSPDDLILPIEFRVKEIKTKMTDSLNATTSKTYIVTVAGTKPGMGPASKVIRGWQDIGAILMGGIDGVGSLVLKGSNAVEDRPLATVKFSI